MRPSTTVQATSKHGAASVPEHTVSYSSSEGAAAEGAKATEQRKPRSDSRATLHRRGNRPRGEGPKPQCPSKRPLDAL